MKSLPIQSRTLALLVVIVPLLALFVYVALRSGPLAPVPVTVVTVEKRSISPALVRHRYSRGPLHLQDRPDLCRAGQKVGCACG